MYNERLLILIHIANLAALTSALTWNDASVLDAMFGLQAHFIITTG